MGRCDENVPGPLTHYASAVSWRAACRRWAAVFLGVFALLFSPATDESSGGSSREQREALGARILAPTGFEAIEGTGFQLANGGVQLGKQRSWPASVPLAVPPAVTALLLLWISFACGFRSARAPRLFALRSLAPRGPPTIEMA
jgi:hypothetical protein